MDSKQPHKQIWIVFELCVSLNGTLVFSWTLSLKTFQSYLNLRSVQPHFDNSFQKTHIVGIFKNQNATLIRTDEKLCVSANHASSQRTLHSNFLPFTRTKGGKAESSGFENSNEARLTRSTYRKRAYMGRFLSGAVTHVLSFSKLNRTIGAWMPLRSYGIQTLKSTE